MNIRKVAQALLWGVCNTGFILPVFAPPVFNASNSVTLGGIHALTDLVNQPSNHAPTKISYYSLSSSKPIVESRATSVDSASSSSTESQTTSDKLKTKIVVDLDDTVIKTWHEYYNHVAFGAFQKRKGFSFNNFAVNTFNKLLQDASFMFDGKPITEYEQLNSASLSLPLYDRSGKKINDFIQFLYSAMNYLKRDRETDYTPCVTLTSEEWKVFSREHADQILFISAAHPAHTDKRVAQLKALGITLSPAVGREETCGVKFAYNATTQGDESPILLSRISENVCHIMNDLELGENSQMTKATVTQNLLKDVQHLIVVDDQARHLFNMQKEYENIALQNPNSALQKLSLVEFQAPAPASEFSTDNWDDSKWNDFEQQWNIWLRKVLTEYLEHRRNDFKQKTLQVVKAESIFDAAARANITTANAIQQAGEKVVESIAADSLRTRNEVAHALNATAEATANAIQKAGVEVAKTIDDNSQELRQQIREMSQTITQLSSALHPLIQAFNAIQNKGVLPIANHSSSSDDDSGGRAPSIPGGSSADNTHPLPTPGRSAPTSGKASASSETSPTNSQHSSREPSPNNTPNSSPGLGAQPSTAPSEVTVVLLPPTASGV